MVDIETRAILLLQGSPARKGIPITYNISRAHAIEAICRAIEQHEATKQEFDDYKKKVSDAVKLVKIDFENVGDLYRFIIPKPKPDPLVEVLEEVLGAINNDNRALQIRAALEARNLKIVEVKNDE